MKDQLKNLAARAVNAPSGDNSQPWAFKLAEENTLEIFNLPNVDATLYNFKQRGSFVAHGALLQNIELLSGTVGLRIIQTSLFPDPSQPDLVARLTFEAGNIQPDRLAAVVEKRSTNRKAYQNKLLPKEFYSEISELNSSYKTQIILRQDKQSIETLAATICLNEKLILENQTIHKEIFDFIRWSPQEMANTRMGHDIKSLELKPPQQATFRLFSHWPVLKFLNHFHVAKLVTNDTRKVYANSACFAMITATDNNPTNFIETGRLLEQVWLIAANYGISLQPTTALLYLQQRINEREANELSTAQQNEITQANQAINQIFDVFDVKGRLPTMLFRLGFSDPPSAVSLKHSPKYIN